jgi:hypothetical protein
MRQTAQAFLVLGLVCLLPQAGRAGGDEATAIINKAIKAHYPKGVDTKHLGLRVKSKGTLHIQGMDLDFTQEVAVQMPNKFKETMELTVNNMKVNTIAVYNGKQGWVKAAGKEIPVEKELLAEFQEAAYSMGLAQGMFLKDKGLKFSLLGEVKVKGKPAVGVKVSKEGKKDLSFYFDKATGLVAKVEVRKRDFMTDQEVTEERIITAYQDVQDRKVAKKVEVLRDGNPFLEMEVQEVQVLERLDDSEFARP